MLRMLIWIDQDRWTYLLQWILCCCSKSRRCFDCVDRRLVIRYGLCSIEKIICWPRSEILRALFRQKRIQGIAPLLQSVWRLLVYQSLWKCVACLRKISVHASWLCECLNYKDDLWRDQRKRPHDSWLEVWRGTVWWCAQYSKEESRSQSKSLLWKASNN